MEFKTCEVRDIFLATNYPTPRFETDEDFYHYNLTCARHFESTCICKLWIFRRVRENIKCYENMYLIRCCETRREKIILARSFGSGTSPEACNKILI